MRQDNNDPGMRRLRFRGCQEPAAGTPARRENAKTARRLTSLTGLRPHGNKTLSFRILPGALYRQGLSLDPPANSVGLS
jgi:hypothetical protein